MGKCNKCGFEISPSSKFCDNCGAAAQPPEPQQSIPVEQPPEPTPVMPAPVAPTPEPPVQEPPTPQQWETKQPSVQQPQPQQKPPMQQPPQQQWQQQQPPMQQPPQQQWQQQQPPMQQPPQQQWQPQQPPIQQPPQQQWQSQQPPIQQPPQQQWQSQQPPAQQPPQQQWQAQRPMQQPSQQQWQQQQPPTQPPPQQQWQPGQPPMQPPRQPKSSMQGGEVATLLKNNKPIVFIGAGVVALIVVILIIVAIVGALSGGDSDDPNIGLWTADEMTMMGMTMNPTDIYPDGITLEIKSGDKCTLTMDGDSFNADYEIEGNVFTMTQRGDEFTGTINGNVIEITNLLDMGLDIVFVKDGMSGENSQGAGGTGAVIDENNLTGRYILSSMTTAGVVMNYDAIQQAEIEMTLEIDGEDGTLVAYGSSMSIDLDTSAKTMLLQGVVMDYVIEDENIVATGENAGHEMVFVFTAENSSIWDDASGGGINATGFVPPGYGTEETVPVETLSTPSVWYGIVTISNYVGNDDISGEYEAWGYIGADELGDYFELYLNGYVDSEDYISFMSFNIELHDYSFFPIVDEHAWLYGDAPLKEEDNTWFVPGITNGVLGATYDYDYNGESFTIDFSIAMISDGSSVDTPANTVTEGSTDAAPESESAPVAAGPSFTMEELRDVYLAILDLSIDEKFALTHEEVLSRYFNGINGNITNQGDTFISYQWISIESETSLLNISFNINDDGSHTYKSMSINNIDYE